MLFYHTLFQKSSICKKKKEIRENLLLDVLEENGHIVFLKRIKEGATTNSYGIHVAELAGVPQTVIKRATEILQSFHKEIPLSSISVEIEKEEKPKLTMPSLFSEEEMILDEILSTNPEDITPIQALQLIHRWKSRLMPL